MTSAAELDAESPMGRQPSLIKRSKSRIMGTSVEEHIDNIGSGAYQLHVFMFCAGALLCEAVQLSTVSGVQHIILREYHVTGDVEQSMLMTILFLGFTVGTLASGTVGDSKGRRLPMLIGFLGMVVMQVLIVLVPGLTTLYVLIFLLGFFAGIGIPAAVTLINEVSPTPARDMMGAAICIGFALGELWTAVGLKLFVPDLSTGPWHYTLLWAALPPSLLLLAGLFSPVTRYDSPLFLSVHHRNEELIGSLKLIRDMNGVDYYIDEQEAVSGNAPEELTFIEVLREVFGLDPVPHTDKEEGGHNLAMSTFVLIVLFFTYNFGYYGTVDFWPIGWSHVHIKDLDKATELIFTALMGFPGVAIAMFMMTAVPWRLGVSSTGSLCALGAMCLLGLTSGKMVVGWSGVILFKLVWMTFQMIAVNLPTRIYRSEVSVWGWSIVCFFGRIGCILAPLDIELGASGYLITLACCLTTSAVLVWLLPESEEETIKGKDDDNRLVSLGAFSGYGAMKDIQQGKEINL